MRHIGYIDLPEHRGSGGFDHADIHSGSNRLYVAHTANDALDVIDMEQDKYVRSIGGLTEVAGALVSEERGLVFTSNRGENTVSLIIPGAEDEGWRSGSGWNSVGVVSVFNLESSGVQAPERRPRHDERYHEV